MRIFVTGAGWLSKKAKPEAGTTRSRRKESPFVTSRE